jgi:AcrR family transcriptional regulator
MAKNRTGIETSAKILLAAKKEFLEKGFEKAKMEDIAARAGFNKVMLYYHFDSKEKLLRELIGGMLSDAKLKIAQAFKSVKSLKSVDPELLVKRLKGIIGGNSDIIRLIASEVLKGNFPLSEVLDTFSGLYEIVIGAAKKAGARVDEPEKAYVRMFFFQTIPLILFNLYSKEVADSYGLSPRRIEEIFAEKFRDTFFQTFFRDLKKTKERNR